MELPHSRQLPWLYALEIARCHPRYDTAHRAVQAVDQKVLVCGHGEVGCFVVDFAAGKEEGREVREARSSAAWLVERKDGVPTGANMVASGGKVGLAKGVEIDFAAELLGKASKEWRDKLRRGIGKGLDVGVNPCRSGL